jgi:hypothetical protein
MKPGSFYRYRFCPNLSREVASQSEDKQSIFRHKNKDEATLPATSRWETQSVLKVWKAANKKVQTDVTPMSLLTTLFRHHVIEFGPIGVIFRELQTVSQNIPRQVMSQLLFLEDALGRIACIPTEIITTFDEFQLILEKQFQHAPGLQKVKLREYALVDESTRETLDAHKSWDSAYIPGRKVNMSMVFKSLPVVRRLDDLYCPGCMGAAVKMFYDTRQLQW